MSKPIIEVEHLSKCYRIGATRERYLSLREELAKKTRHISSAFSRAFRKGQTGPSDSETDFWALNDVSFTVQEGEAVGIIGRNGAGKSTLLKILSQITPPTKGRITMRGRVASLLEVGTGFHNELTGRENIFLNGAILGMTRAEIRKKFDEIVAFSEIEKFLDTPVKRYSSGMYVRLAFAVAAHLEPEILIVDEVLAVGDAQFQKKCLGKMKEVGKEGRTVLFVSHNMAAVNALCEKAIFIAGGIINAVGLTDMIISMYLSESKEIKSMLQDRDDRSGTGKAKFTNIGFFNNKFEPVNTIISGRHYALILRYKSDTKLSNPVIKISIYNSIGQIIVHCDSSLYQKINELPSGEGALACCFEKFPLAKGMYYINLGLEANNDMLDHVISASSFMVEDGDFFGTGKTIVTLKELCLVDHTWKIL